jgi:NADH:ubiquinone oxidoreductase subunit K
LPLLFNLLLSITDLLSYILEEHLHIDIVSRERCQQFVSKSLDLIANDSDLLGESLIYLSNLHVNLIPYLMVHSLQFLPLLADLEFCLILNFLNLACVSFLDSLQNIFGPILTFNEVIVSEAELLIDLLFEICYLSVAVFRHLLEFDISQILHG